MSPRKHRDLTRLFLFLGAGFLVSGLVGLTTARAAAGAAMGAGAAVMFFFAYREHQMWVERRRRADAIEEDDLGSESAPAEQTRSEPGSLVEPAAPELRDGSAGKRGESAFPQSGESALAAPKTALAPAPAKQPAPSASRAASVDAEIERLKGEAEAAVRSQDWDAARRVYRELVLRPPSAFTPISEAEAYYGLGLVHERLGETRRAIQFLERATRSDANFAPARELLAKLQA